MTVRDWESFKTESWGKYCTKIGCRKLQNGWLRSLKLSRNVITYGDKVQEGWVGHVTNFGKTGNGYKFYSGNHKIRSSKPVIESIPRITARMSYLFTRVTSYNFLVSAVISTSGCYLRDSDRRSCRYGKHYFRTLSALLGHPQMTFPRCHVYILSRHSSRGRTAKGTHIRVSLYESFLY
jgi:hypothetical protein